MTNHVITALVKNKMGLLLASNNAPLFKRSALATTIGIITLALASCGGSGSQDRGSSTVLKQEFSGVAVDGHISRATVFLDTNNNGTRDPWEPYAYTDDEGYYGNNPKTGVNYCASDATKEDAQYCLKTNANYGDVVVRIDGGYDSLTGEPFLAQLSRRINANDPADTVNTVISPITTLVTAAASTTEQKLILANLGMTTTDLNIDYLNARGNNEVNPWLLNTALKIHKTVTVLSDRIDDNYPEMGEKTGMPNGASLTVYRSLAQELALKSKVLDAVLTDPAQLITVLNNAEEGVRAAYKSRNIALPVDMGNNRNADRFDRVSKIAAEVPKVIDRLLNPMDIAMDQGQVLGNVRALEALIIKATKEEKHNDLSLDNAFTFFLDDNNDSQREALRLALSDDKADLSSLSKHSFEQYTLATTESINQIARLQDNATAFSHLAGKKLRVSDLDLGMAPKDLKDIEIELNFLGAENSVKGGVIACAKYIEDASKDSLGEGNFRGELITGYWSLLGATSDNSGSYSLLLTFEFLGANYQAIMKPAGDTTISGVKYKQIRFDNNGDFRIWHSKNGFETQTKLPTTSNDCQASLPSRVGL